MTELSVEIDSSTAPATAAGMPRLDDHSQDQLSNLAYAVDQCGAAPLARSDLPDALLTLLSQLGRRAEIAHWLREFAIDKVRLHHLLKSPLSPRELEVMTRLLDGDRVPAIATAMFVSQSTVRNHLASLFRKVGVRSQQGLIDALRAREPAAPMLLPKIAAC